MKRVTNTSFQTWTVPLITEHGVDHYWLKPNESIVVPASYISKIVKNLHQRRLVSISNHV